MAPAYMTNRAGRGQDGWASRSHGRGPSLSHNRAAATSIPHSRNGRSHSPKYTLQRRLGVASRRSSQTAANCPAILLVFDMLELGLLSVGLDLTVHLQSQGAA